MGMPMVNINSGGAAIPGIPGMLVSPVAPGPAIEADQAIAGSEVGYSADGAAPSSGGAGGAGSSAPWHDPKSDANKERSTGSPSICTTSRTSPSPASHMKSHWSTARPSRAARRTRKARRAWTISIPDNARCVSRGRIRHP